MAIGNLTSKVSRSDLANTNNKVNHGEFEEGFEDSGGEGLDGFEFDSLDDFASEGGSGESSFGPSREFGGPSSAFSGGSNAFGEFGGLNAFGSMQAQQAPVEPPKPSAYDKAWDFSVDGIANTFKVIVEIVNSIKNRNIDDWSLLSQNLLVVGGVFSVLGVVGLFIGIIGKVRFLGMGGMSPHILIAGCFDLFLGLCGLGVSALLKLSGVKGSELSRQGLDSITTNPATQENNDSIIEEADDEFDSLMAELFEEEELPEDASSDEHYSSDSFSDNIDFSSFGSGNTDTNEVDFEKLVNEVPSNQPLLNREFLFNTFSKFFVTNTPNFDQKTVMDTSTDEYLALVTLLNQALASALKVDEEDMDAQIETVEETLFAYVITFKRPKGPKNMIGDIERELADFFKEDERDETVTATVRTRGSFYVATISKGAKSVITVGDCVRTDVARKYFCDTSHRLPFIMGIDDYGQAVYDDCKNYTSMLIAGLARSGKSWYLLSIILTLACFNPPEEVQFVLVDPKDTVLFKRLGLLPHTAGLALGHEGSCGILGILEDIINIEAPRRSKLLADNSCDDIWALRDKGVTIPFLFVVIDEIMTVILDLEKRKDDSDKLLSNYMITIMTQYPSKGIGLIFVPHRATGIIDKTQRTLVPFTAAVKSKNDDILDTLGIKKWSRPLTLPGEMAVNTSFFSNPKYLKGTGVTLSDDSNIEFITTIARTFYKMGVELPDMTSLGRGYTRDEEQIKNDLDLAVNSKVQFDLDDLDGEG